MLLLCAIQGQLKAQNQYASGFAHVHSVGLADSIANPNKFETNEEVRYFFTTYDGQTDRFPLSDNRDGSLVFSGELKPSAEGTDQYVADYAVRMGTDTWLETGSVSLSVPTTDADANGVYDWLQLWNSVDMSVTGTMTPDGETSVSLTGTFQRDRGDPTGSYAIEASDGTIITGQWSVVRAISQTTYDLGNSTITLATDGNSELTAQTLIGTSPTSFTRKSDDEIELSSFTMDRTGRGLALGPGDFDGTISVNGPITLSRSGIHYRGKLKLSEGEAGTSWPDFTEWTLEFTDTNDKDGADIPDLSDGVFDPVPPTLRMDPMTGHIILQSTQVKASFLIEWSSDLKTWTSLSDSPIPKSNVIDGSYSVVTVVVPSGQNKFFRLRTP